MINYRQLASDYQAHGAREVCHGLTEGIREGHLRPSDFSLRSLAAALVTEGYQWVESLNPAFSLPVTESAEAVDSSAFTNITQELIRAEILSTYENPAYAISEMFPTLSTRRQHSERIPGMGQIGDEALVVHEGMPFPSIGLDEDYIETPVADKRGLKILITKEAIFYDNLGLILERARQVGEALRISKEKRCIDALIGHTNNHKWMGTNYDTYQASTPWKNVLAGAGYDLVDWTDIDAAEQLFSEMVDPHTGEPIVIAASQLVACPAKKHHINRVINATEIRYTDSSAPTETLAANPITGYTGTTSALLYGRLQSQLGLTADQAKATWFFGDVRKAFRYVEHWPMKVSQLVRGSDIEFTNDIVAGFRADEKGQPFAFNPRYVAKISGYD